MIWMGAGAIVLFLQLEVMLVFLLLRLDPSLLLLPTVTAAVILISRGRLVALVIVSSPRPTCLDCKVRLDDLIFLNVAVIFRTACT